MIIKGDNYRFTVLTDRLIRMEYQEEGKFVDSMTQVIQNREFEDSSVQVEENEKILKITTDALMLEYDKKKFHPEGLSVKLKTPVSITTAGWHYMDETFDLGGTARTLDNTSGEVAIGHGIISRDGFTVLDDSNSALIKADRWVEARPEKGIDLYFFGYGHAYAECMRDYYHLTGMTPLLPRFVFGNWWSRYYKYSEESYRTLIERFDQEKIPFTAAVIDMDWHLTDNVPDRFGTGWTGYTWDKDLFPDPERFLSYLHQKGLRTTLNLHPADGVRAYEDGYSQMAEALGVDPAGEKPLTFAVTDKEYMSAYFKYMIERLEEQGVDFWWIDWQQGLHSGIEGIDMLWMLNYLHYRHEEEKPEPSLIFSRYAGPGSHRYPIGFSGDTVTCWESLRLQPGFTATASNIGYSWWSHDIGGHMQGKRDDELTVRWVQFGVFSPVMRLHSSMNVFYGKEPWNYGEKEERILKEYLRLRKRLIPYLYTANYRTAENGLPLIQPLYYKNDCWEAYEFRNEYYFGDSLIVAPVTDPADRESLLAGTDVWLPEGRYTDFFTGIRYEGGRTIRMFRNLESIPVLVPDGSVIMMDMDDHSFGAANPACVEVQLFAGADGKGEMIEDDGKKNGIKTNTKVRFSQKDCMIHVSAVCTGAEDADWIRNRKYYITLRGFAGIQKVDIAESGGGSYQLIHGNEKDSVQQIMILNAGTGFTLDIRVASAEQREPDHMDLIMSFLQHAQIEYTQKDQIYQILTQGEDKKEKLVKLIRIVKNHNLLEAITELL